MRAHGGTENMLICEEITANGKQLAISWLHTKCVEAFPKKGMPQQDIPEMPWDFFPETGIQVKNEYGRILAVAFLYLEKSSKMSVAGNIVANPVNLKKESYEAIEQALCFLPNYAKGKGAAYLQTFFGNRGICDIAESLGYKDGDPVVRNQLLIL